MLTDLSLRNLAIIEHLHISFRTGLTVLTGETGAGKSIIIDGVALLMGGRASGELIRTGADEAVVEACFDLTRLPDLSTKLAEAGFDGGGTELLIRRSLSRTGKNRIFVNGTMATLAQLSEISRSLINIYGQHESQTLLKPDNHLFLLDEFAVIQQMRELFSKLFVQLKELRSRMHSFAADEREAAQRLDILSFQAEEIGGANLMPGEEEELEERRQVLSNAGKLAGVSSQLFEELYGSDSSLLGQLRKMGLSLTDIAGIDHSLKPLSEALNGAYLQLEDMALTLRDYASRRETSPGELQSAEDRLDLIRRLKRKYGADIGEILAHKQRCDEEIVELSGRASKIEELAEQCRLLESDLTRCGTELTEARRIAADSLKSAMEKEIRELAMKDAVLEIALVPLPEPRQTGCERIEFLLSPNPGEIPRPLSRIASGGELSRLMLAIKQVLPGSDVPTLVFDEVDTGIGGSTSDLVGRKLSNVAAGQQVLCITHLPQVAAWASHHIRVEKSVVDGRTTTAVTELDHDERVLELARMSAGSKVSDAAIAHARDMLLASRQQA